MSENPNTAPLYRAHMLLIRWAAEARIEKQKQQDQAAQLAEDPRDRAAVFVVQGSRTAQGAQ